ncbi:MAG: glutaminase A [Synechococcales bacterium]|nr:glutaminase A [Synechococcales bacterium]
MNFPSHPNLVLTPQQLEDWVIQARACARSGRLPTYIAKLAIAQADWFAAHIRLLNGTTYAAGDTQLTFALMSVVKPLLLLYLLETLGDEPVWSRIGLLPSDQAFNSITQLQKDQGFPRNPMLNSGAIALASLMPGGNGGDRCKHLCQWLNQRANCRLTLDTAMLSAVRSLPNERNRAIAQVLAQAGRLASSVAIAIDTYEQICCLAGTVADLSQMGLLLVARQTDIQPAHQRQVVALMATCGMYERSGQFALEVGLPAKSGVSGALLAVVPRCGAIACYSPPLDPAGNSAGGVAFLAQISRALNLSIFGP